MENRLLWDEIGIIMGCGGFKSKRELFYAKLGIIVNKEGWENYTHIKLQEMIMQLIPVMAQIKNVVIAKCEDNPLLEMDIETHLESWVYEANYLMTIIVVDTVYVFNLFRGEVNQYLINKDFNICHDILEATRMWVEDIDKAKEIQFKIAQLEKKKHIVPNGKKIVELQQEMDSFYDEGEGTDDYYNFLVKKKYLRHKDIDFSKDHEITDTERMYINRVIEIDAAIKYLNERRAKTEYWMINHMRSNSLKFIRTESMVPFTVKHQNRGVYLIQKGNDLQVDYKKVSYRPNMRALKNKLDQAFE